MCWWRNTLIIARSIAKPKSTPAPVSNWTVPLWPIGLAKARRLLRPLVDAVGAHVMAADRIFADDTTVPVLDPGRGSTKTGRLWCYVRDDRPFAGAAPPAVLYRYSPDRKGEHPRSHLAGFRGILQADGYAGYSGIYECGVTEAACMAHCRRPFFELHASDGSPLALEALQRIAALYAIEDQIRGQPPEVRLRVRQAQSAPSVRQFAHLAGANADADLRQVPDGGRYPLHADTMGRADLGIARWPRLHRQQRRRARHATDSSGQEELAACRFGCRW